MKTNMRLPVLVVVCLAAAGLTGCGNKEGSGAGSGQTAGAQAGAKGLVHGKVVKDECTFEWDAPEALKETEAGANITLQGTSFKFLAYSGVGLGGIDGLAQQSRMMSSLPPIFESEEFNQALVVTPLEKPPKPIDAIYGRGEEEGGKDGLGCGFSCTGVKERQAEVLAFCQSVRITVDKSKRK